tara:strand:- start:284 stop:445 length:162 start_codon:yes stop_codon:yes gene_type:complete
LAFFDNFKAVCHLFLSIALNTAFAVAKSFLDNIEDFLTLLLTFLTTIIGFFAG